MSVNLSAVRELFEEAQKCAVALIGVQCHLNPSNSPMAGFILAAQVAHCG